MRKGFLALAAFAAFSVLAQPVCAALDLRLPAAHLAVTPAGHADTDPGESTLCCAETDGTLLAALSPAGKAKAVPAAPGVVPVRLAAPFRTSAPQLRLAPIGAPPPLQPSYYARSARILR